MLKLIQRYINVLYRRVKENIVEIAYMWIILWLASVIGATIIGARKNMAISACFFGLIFGPLGVILVLISKRKK